MENRIMWRRVICKAGKSVKCGGGRVFNWDVQGSPLWSCPFCFNHALQEPSESDEMHYRKILEHVNRLREKRGGN
jgi:hypothetical protein